MSNEKVHTPIPRQDGCGVMTTDITKTGKTAKDHSIFSWWQMRYVFSIATLTLEL